MKLHPARGVVDAGLRPPRVKITETERRVLTVDNATSDPEAQSRVTALETALRELGWVKGRNLSIEYRWPGEWKHRAQPCKQGSRSVGQHALVFTARKCTYEGAPQVCPSNRTTRF
jgi:hypothetical protein